MWGKIIMKNEDILASLLLRVSLLEKILFNKKIIDKDEYMHELNSCLEEYKKEITLNEAIDKKLKGKL